MSKNNYRHTPLSTKRVPTLRFKEFENSGEWDYLNGNEIFEPISNKNHNSDLPILAITQENGAIPRDMIDYNISVTDKSIESYKVVEVGDFIISLRSFQGGIEYSNYLGLCSPAYIILRKKIDVENDFYRHYFKSNSFIRDLNKNLEGIRDGKMVSYNQFSEILLPKPISKEQQKIADCLSSLDDLITAENKKLESLKAHKKGLMQNLFPAEGEKVPKRRFKGNGVWVKKTLNKFGLFYRGLTYNSSDVSANGLLVLRAGNIQNENLVLDKDLVFVNKECPLDLLLQKGDVVICMSNGSKSLVGKNAEYLGNYPDNVTVGAFCSIFRSQNRFAKFMLQTDAYQKFVSLSIGGGNINNLKNSDLEEYSCVVPEDPKEQQKIASCLSSLDDQITAQCQKIEALKKHKKGLIQGLFPKLSAL